MKKPVFEQKSLKNEQNLVELRGVEPKSRRKNRAKERKKAPFYIEFAALIGLPPIFANNIKPFKPCQPYHNRYGIFLWVGSEITTLSARRASGFQITSRRLNDLPR